VETQRIDERLIEEIEVARLRCDRFVIVESLPYFAQLMPNHRSLYGEVISDTYLEGPDRLSPRQEQRLIDLGWGPPGRPCHPACPSSLHPNYSMTWPATTASSHIARDLLAGLLVVMAGRGEGGQAFTVKSLVRTTEPSSGVAPRH